MCGRFFVIPSNPVIRGFLDQMNRSPLADGFRGEDGLPLSASGEILPASVVPVLASDRKGVRRVFPMKWGFSRRSFQGGSGSRLLINARTESASEKPTFRESWFSHRCVVPASWYFEWDHPAGPDGKRRPGQKYAIRPESEEICWLAGLYRMENGLPSFVILTGPAVRNLSWMHDRMPLVFPEAAAKDWVRPGADPAVLAEQSLTGMQWSPAS